MVRIRIKWIAIFSIETILILLSASREGWFLITAIILVWLDLIIYTFEDICTRCAMFAYLVAFFAFLIGRDMLERYGLHTINVSFPERINKHAEALLLTSLLSLGTGYFVSPIFSIKRRKSRPIEYSSSHMINIRKVSIYVFLFTYIFNVYSIIEVVRFVFRYGYVAYYTTYISSVPYLIIKIGDMSPIAFWVFMATMPRKRDSVLYSILYVLYLFITLGTGKRFEFVSGLLMIFIYFLMRNYVNPNEEKWFGHREILISFVLLPLLMFSMSALNVLRVHKDVTFGNISEGATAFIYEIGNSINFIKRTELCSSSIPTDRFYMLSGVSSYLRSNPISKLLGVTYYSGNTVEHALYGNSLSHLVSYLTMGNQYLNGSGHGGCYIADAFQDLGYFGVIFINVLYGIMFRKSFDFSKKGVCSCAVSFMVLISLMATPRANADRFVTAALDLTTWATILFIFLIVRVLEQRTVNAFSDECV